jgi:hypothetical protein
MSPVRLHHMTTSVSVTVRPRVTMRSPTLSSS